MTSLTDLPPLVFNPAAQVRNARRFLLASHNSVSAMFAVVDRIEDSRRNTNGDARGRMAQEEVDILRSAIVFTSSGLDAAMKRLVSDVGRFLIARPGNEARDSYERQMKQWLSSDSVDENLRSAVIAQDPAGALVDYYIAMRTKASFQGSGDLRVRVRNTLGITKAAVSDAALASLDPFFQARNSIAHSMDFRDVDTSTGRARVHRSKDTTVTMCDRAFRVAASLIAAAEAAVRTAP